jgi:hypothetical protein
VQVLHREEVAGVVVPDIEHLDDVLVMELRGEPRFLEEHLHELAIACELREHALDDDALREALEPRELREKQFRHPTVREATGDLVTAELLGMWCGLHPQRL